MTKIFICYRRDDAAADAARIGHVLAARFGKASIFIDIDNLLAGQRFDVELAKALSSCDVLLVIIGSRWRELLLSRIASDDRDYVREEIAAGLKRSMVVIPVRVGRVDALPPLPRHNELPDDIRDLVLHQMVDVTHERFSRDSADLIEAISSTRRARRPTPSRPAPSTEEYSRLATLKEWIDTQPIEVARVVAARAALRILPLAIEPSAKGFPAKAAPRSVGIFSRLFGRQSESALPSSDGDANATSIVIPVFRAVAVTWIAAVVPRRPTDAIPSSDSAQADVVLNIAETATVAGTALADVSSANYAASSSSTKAISGALAAIGGAIRTAGRTPSSQGACIAIDDAANACAFLQGAAHFILAAETDRSFISKGGTSYDLAAEPLWYGKTPIFVDATWKRACAALAAIDQGFDIWIDWYSNRLLGSSFDIQAELRRVLFAEEIWSQTPATINAYIKQVMSKNIIDGPELKPINRVRAIFVGHGDAGKTSLIAALQGETIVSGNKGMTTGIALTEVEPDVIWRERRGSDRLPTVYFWDFGGQVMAHHTHQFFLRSNCVYVIVLDGRRNDKATDDARYWLEHVRAYGESSSVLIVGNKDDLARVWVDIAPLQRVFGKSLRIVGFFPVSCTEAKNLRKTQFDAFRDAFELEVSAAADNQVVFSAAQLGLLANLRERAKADAFLDRHAFGALCKAHGISSGKEGGLGEEQLLALFDTLGIVVHFKDIRALDTMLLNPEWLTKGVYTILYSQEMKNKKGKATVDDIVNILAAESPKDQAGRPLKFDRQRAHFLIEAMRRFKILFRVPESEEILVIPALLDSAEPLDHNFDFSSAWAFRFKFDGFMPEHVLPSLMVDRHSDIDKSKSGELVWKYGMVLRPPIDRYEAEAFVQKVENDRTLTIWVRGRDGHDYLGVLRDCVARSLSRMPHIPVREEVALTSAMRLEEQSETAPGTGPGEIIQWDYYSRLHAELKAGRGAYIGPDGAEYSLALINPRLPAAGAEIEVLSRIDTTLSELMYAVSTKATKTRFEAPKPRTLSQLRHVRIFLSSPGDVAEEREIARELIKNRLSVAPFLRDRVTFDVISWDDPHAPLAMPASLPPHVAIDRGLRRPSECDIVVVILWSRMGTPLPPEYVKDSGGSYLSGTEWELTDALGAASHDGKPVVFIYRRTDDPKVSMDAPDLQDRIRQRTLVKSFFETLRNDDGSQRYSLQSYDTLDRFRNMLDSHIQQTIRSWQETEGARPKGDLVEMLRLAHQAFRGMERRSPGEIAAAKEEVRRLLIADASLFELTRDDNDARATLGLLAERLVD